MYHVENYKITICFYTIYIDKCNLKYTYLKEI